MLYDHTYFHLQFNYEEVREAEEAKKVVAEMIKNHLSNVKDVRLYRKKNQVRLGIPYQGLASIVNRIDSLTSEDAEKILGKIEAIANGLPGCGNLEVSVYWHIID